MHKYILTLIFYIASFSGSVYADVLSASHLSSYRAEFEYFSQGKEGRLSKQGSWTDLLEIEDSSLVRTVTRKSLSENIDLVRTVAASREKLNPIYMSQRYGRQLESLYHSQLDEGKLTQLLLPNYMSKAKLLTSDLPSDVVESNLQGVLATALPFESESEIQVKGYSGGASPSTTNMVFEVQGAETVSATGADFLTWKVTDTGSNWTYWVRKEAPYLVKVAHPGPDGNMLISTLVRFELLE